MITLITHDKNLIKLNSLSELKEYKGDFLAMQIMDYSEQEISELEVMYGIDCDIMSNKEDIEISSHYLETKKQVALHYSIPYFLSKTDLKEQNAFMILNEDRIFYFMSSKLNDYFVRLYQNKLEADIQDVLDNKQVFKLILAFVSDYFADLTEYISKQIITSADKIFIRKEIMEADLDTLTDINFNNLLVRESSNEIYKILNLFRKSRWCTYYEAREFINEELEDMSVVSEYVQSNFDRLDDLKENVNSKINLEQNHIVKILTMVTLSIALPTLIAGIYGMNFKYMPELNREYGYPMALLFMVLSAFIPLLYFKRKKWL